MLKKQFIFKYDPSASLKEMFEGFNEALKTGRPDIQPSNTLVSNNLEVIYRCLTPARLEIFTCLIEKKPNNLTELAQLLKRDYANVWKDIQALQGLEIIKLKKVGKEIQPIALYEQITFDFSAVRKPSATPSLHLTTNP
ncbi:protein of unknown function [endosymbiont DhMRE of Dentiscutata heterogama]|uniref:HVO_A0114 family putative DNA-binding protein n=1 Tax=endosymbiont DhMRE of Dentiscutata heterogama TaxID=1609546 RepID=UPI000637E963|nr:hypothetical protein [endosymbiont DhMRE of Dentiscutata heterogama]CFW92738.1 protein of unknown function [endosymbiont DhMRE of Dentiscutata heterogama]